MFTCTSLAGRALRKRCNESSPAVELGNAAAKNNQPIPYRRLIETDDTQKAGSAGMAALAATRETVYQTFDSQPVHLSPDISVTIDAKDAKQNPNEIDKQNQQMAALIKAEEVLSGSLLPKSCGLAFWEGFCITFPFMVDACCTTCTCVGRNVSDLARRGN